MDKRQIPELMKITFDTSNANDLQSALQYVEKDMRAFGRVVSSATNDLKYYQTNMKKIITDETSQKGYFKQSVMVNKADADNVYAALIANNASRFGENAARGSHEWAYDIQMKAAPVVTGVMKLVGDEALKIAKAQAQALGGDIWRDPTKKNPYRTRYFYPSDMAEDITGAEKVAPFGAARRESRRAKRDLDEQLRIQKEKEQAQEAARIVAEEQKNKKARQQEVDRFNKEEERRKKEKEKAEATRKRKALAEDKRLQREAQLKIKEDDKKQQMLKQANLESKRKTVHLVKNIASLVTVAVDLLRRISVAALEKAASINRETTEAHNIGLSYAEARRMKYFDKAHGLPEGTSTGAISAIQGLFGDVTNLDEGALEVLARVMGGDVANLVRSGMGGKEPDRLLENILDKYFKQFKEGKNSLGQQVGQGAALRELYSSLEGVSGEVANLFAQMANDYLSGYYGDFNTAAEWSNTTKVPSGNLTAADMALSAEVGKNFNEFTAELTRIKDDFLTRFSFKLNSILDRIKELGIGKSAQEKLDDIGSRLIRVREAKEDTDAAIGIYSDLVSGSSTFKKMSGDYSLDQILKVGLGIGDSGVPFYKQKEVMGIFNSLIGSSDSEFAGRFARLAMLTKYSKDLEKEAGKEVGDASIKDVTLSDAALIVGTQDLVKSHASPSLLHGTSHDVKVAALANYLRADMEASRSSDSSTSPLVDYIRNPKGYWKYGTKAKFDRLGLTQALPAGSENWSDDQIINWVAEHAAETWTNDSKTELFKKAAAEMAADKIGVGKSLIEDTIYSEMIRAGALGKNAQFSVTGNEGRYILELRIDNGKGGTDTISVPIIDGGVAQDYSGLVDMNNGIPRIIYSSGK